MGPQISVQLRATLGSGPLVLTPSLLRSNQAGTSSQAKAADALLTGLVTSRRCQTSVSVGVEIHRLVRWENTTIARPRLITTDPTGYLIFNQIFGLFG